MEHLKFEVLHERMLEIEMSEGIEKLKMITPAESIEKLKIKGLVTVINGKTIFNKEHPNYDSDSPQKNKPPRQQQTNKRQKQTNKQQTNKEATDRNTVQWKCEVCDHPYKNKDSLGRHKRKVHNIYAVSLSLIN